MDCGITIWVLSFGPAHDRMGGSYQVSVLAPTSRINPDLTDGISRVPTSFFDWGVWNIRLTRPSHILKKLESGTCAPPIHVAQPCWRLRMMAGR